MTREIHEIPPTPRRVKWRAVLWHWWPVAFAGFMCGIYGGLLTLMLFLARGGKQSDDLLIDASSVVVPGKVTRIEGGVTEPLRVSYEYKTRQGHDRLGRSFLARPEVEVGQEIQIEYATRAPHVSRARGGRIAMIPPLHAFFFWILLTPGLVLLATWWCAVLRLRRLMNRGDVGVADVRTIEPLRYVLPTMLRVTYCFRDHRAQVQTASHWVRARSALGERLGTDPTQLAVVHDRYRHGVSRLVMADDFVVEPVGRHDPRHSPHT